MSQCRAILLDAVHPFAMDRLKQRGSDLVYRCGKGHGEPFSRLIGHADTGKAARSGQYPDELVLTPLELIDRIAQLVPPPRTHRHRYYGVLAPNSPLRGAVTAMAMPDEDEPRMLAYTPGMVSSTRRSSRVGHEKSFKSALQTCQSLLQLQPRRTVQTQPTTWLALRDDGTKGCAPAVVERESRSYLECGILAHGLTRLTAAFTGEKLTDVALKCLFLQWMQ